MTHHPLPADCYAGQVVAILTEAGANGMTFQELDERLPLTPNLTMVLYHSRAAGYLFALGGRRRNRRYFAAGVDMGEAAATVEAERIRLDDQRRQDRNRRKAESRERCRGQPKLTKDEVRARIAEARKAKEAEQTKLKEERRAKAAPSAPKRNPVTATNRETRAINQVADKYRGSAAPKERVKPPPEITGMDTAPISYGAPCRSRIEVDESELNGLSKLPIGVYAEPAGFVARAVLEAA